MRTVQRMALICALLFALSPVSADDDDSDEYKKPTPAELLKRYDKNGDGKLSSSEKRAAVKGEYIRRWDKDGDGKLSSSEKKQMKAQKKREEILNGEVNRYFRKYDIIKRDGVLNKDELGRIAKVNRGRQAYLGKKGSDDWIAAADEDKDGEVTRKELRKALKARKKKADEDRKKGKKGGNNKKSGGQNKGGNKGTGNSP